MATLETSLEANYDRRTHGRTKRLIGARATALPKNVCQWWLVCQLFKGAKQVLKVDITRTVKSRN